MTSFKTLNTKKYAKASQVQTPDTIYWKKLSVSLKKKMNDNKCRT